MKLAQKTARIFASVLAGVMLTASAFALESVETTETLSEAGGGASLSAGTNTFLYLQDFDTMELGVYETLPNLLGENGYVLQGLNATRGTMGDVTFEVIEEENGNRCLKVTGYKWGAFGCNIPDTDVTGMIAFSYKFPSTEGIYATPNTYISTAYNYDTATSPRKTGASEAKADVAACVFITDPTNQGSGTRNARWDLASTTEWTQSARDNYTARAYDIGLGFNKNLTADTPMTIYLDDIMVWSNTLAYASVNGAGEWSKLHFDNADGRVYASPNPWDRMVFYDLYSDIGTTKSMPDLQSNNFAAPTIANQNMEFKGWSLSKGGTPYKFRYIFLPGELTLYPVLEERFTMTNLNQIRFDQPAGLRFVSLIDTTAVSNADEYGFIVTREALLDDTTPTANDLTLDSTINKIVGKAYIKNSLDVVFEDKTNTALGVVAGKNKAITAVVANIPNTAYAEKFIVRPYMLVGETTYYSNAATKSYYEVAKAYADGGYVGLDDAQKAAVDEIVKAVEG